MFKQSNRQCMGPQRKPWHITYKQLCATLCQYILRLLLTKKWAIGIATLLATFVAASSTNQAGVLSS